MACDHHNMTRVSYAENTWICTTPEHLECHFTVTAVPQPEPPVLKTSEEKRAFSADWDRRYEEGQRRSLGEQMGHPGGAYG